MANYKIAIVSTELNSITTQNLTNLLSGLGHTITVIAVNTISATSLLSYDLVITARLGAYGSSDMAIMNAVAAGVPAILDGTQDGSSISQTQGSGAPNALGLIYSLTASDASRPLAFVQTVPTQFNALKGLSVSVNGTAPLFRWTAPVAYLAPSGVSIAL